LLDGETSRGPAEILHQRLRDLVFALTLTDHAADPVSHGLEIDTPFQQAGVVGKRAVAGNNGIEIELQDFIQGLGPFDGAAAVGVIDVRLCGPGEKQVAGVNDFKLWK
jgi:hypothetical protein